jgi:hypothetical protein
LFSDDIDGYVSGADLLRDSAGLSILNVRPTKFVQNFSLAGINVT